MLQDLHQLAIKDLVKISRNSWKKELLILNNPVYVDCTVLELSKLAMYTFYYGFVKKKCKNPILLLTDTDSLCFETEENFLEIMLDNQEFFDLSN